MGPAQLLRAARRRARRRAWVCAASACAAAVRSSELRSLRAERNAWSLLNSVMAAEKAVVVARVSGASRGAAGREAVTALRTSWRRSMSWAWVSWAVSMAPSQAVAAPGMRVVHREARTPRRAS